MSRFIGDRQFYKKIGAIAVPIMIQNGVTQFVSLLDNIMVGRVGTEEMAGVSIVNQLIFVFGMCVIGIAAGAGVFGAQFFGNKDWSGMRNTLRFKLICDTILTVVGVTIFLLAGSVLIQAYLNEGDQGDLELTFGYAKQYLNVMLIGLFPFAISQAYAGTLRDSGQTIVPMIASGVAVAANLAGNYILIFGNFGAPKLGVVGAALATSASRYIELAIIAGWAHANTDKNPFIKGLYRNLLIPFDLAKKMIIIGAPLFFNEVLWSGGVALLAQCYSEWGLSVVAATNISNTIGNLFNVVFLSMGIAISIILGQLLGAGESEQAKAESVQLLAFTLLLCFVVGGLLIAAAPFFPMIYNTTDEVRGLATTFIRIAGGLMPISGFAASCYFTLRSGGKTLVTFLFDSCFMIVINVPVAFVLSRFSGLDIVPAYFIVQSLDVIKCFIGLWLLKKGTWARSLVGDNLQENIE